MATSPFDSVPNTDTDPVDAQPQAIEDTPPRSTRRSKTQQTSSTPKTASRPPKSLTIEQLQEQVTTGISKMGVGLYLFGVSQNNRKIAYDGAVIGENGERIGAAVAQACEKSPKFRKSVESFVAMAGVGILGGVVASVALPIAWNHGLVPQFLVGFIDHPKAFAPDDTPPDTTPENNSAETHTVPAI